MLDRLASMAVFVRAANLGSFAAAAQGLGMTSQMVGKHVRFLEERLGAPLLQRTTRHQSLTEMGRRYYESCCAILAEAEAAEALAQELSTTARGRLLVSAPVTFGACCLAPLVARFLEEHSAVEVELRLTDRYVNVVEEGYDAVVRLGPLQDSSLVARRLVDHSQVACASPAYIARRGAPATPDDLADHDCLGFVNWSDLPYAEWRFTKAGRVHAVQVRSRFKVNDGRVLLAAALDGHGIILQPLAVVRGALDAGRLVPVLPAYAPPARPLFLLFSGRTPQSLKLRTFIDAVVRDFGSSEPSRPSKISRQPAPRP